MVYRIFIDGEAGTTGLKIRGLLAKRNDIELLTIDAAHRKNEMMRRDALNAADIAILCLPDIAAREAVAMIGDEQTRIIDASTAHRTADGWVYGFAEMTRTQHQAIANARRVTNPGCYPQGVIACLRPLIAAGIVPTNYPVNVHAISGYSGGGKAMIEQYQLAEANSPYWPYGLDFAHKHLPEMQHHALMRYPPLFQPAVGNYAQGMLTMAPLHLSLLPKLIHAADIHAILASHFNEAEFIEVMPYGEGSIHEANLDPQSLNDTNMMHLHVFANDQQGHVMLTALYDNLGKGASRAAIQNLNIMLGVHHTTGLQKK